MGKLDGKVALISGAARGMGGEFARAFVEEGASVVIGDVLVDEGTALAAEIGPAARFIKLDVTSEEDWDAAVALAVSDFGHLDVLVNNAGILIGGMIDEFSLEDWNKIIGVNLTGMFLGIHAAAPELKKSSLTPSIINMSSVAAFIAYGGLSGYGAAKAGILGLTKTAAMELAPFGIRVNSVHPGIISTPMTAAMETPQAHVAMKRTGKPEEIARLLVFLASDGASYSTGAEFIADGGELAGLAH